MAESVEPTVGELPQYQLSWTPDGYTKYEQSVLPTTVQEIWVGPDNASLTLLYSTETVEVPEGAAETVEVNGVDAQYWAAEEPYEPSDSSMTVNGEKI